MHGESPAVILHFPGPKRSVRRYLDDVAIVFRVSCGRDILYEVFFKHTRGHAVCEWRRQDEFKSWKWYCWRASNAEYSWLPCWLNRLFKSQFIVFRILLMIYFNIVTVLSVLVWKNQNVNEGILWGRQVFLFLRDKYFILFTNYIYILIVYCGDILWGKVIL